ncbi:4-hydroxy-2-oxo-heptane-1,7-dioate aldolase [Candidatus Thermoflexus japonica]|uniref:4-hydroxy-2-oxo-heptane-1,7-dioate aldolase n=1 Tax=Candidatus Thermoflexus japonica TaxID=2035417 RepID=A0A2H5Y5W6_9CHLR|nr:4-hydroxy-2-oxo-heptane-1,7-dioate aldolase [Candidatus Thermoflexus japonica]
MISNLALRRMRKGEATVGAWLGLGSPYAAALMARMGFDWLVVDTEHSPYSYDAMAQSVMAVLPTGTAPLVRVPWNDPVWIKLALDTGALGVVVPMVMNGEEARRAAEAARFPPRGIRSVGAWLGPRLHGEDYLQAIDEEILVVVQIEHIRAVERAEEICTAEGVDVIFIGPNDLASSMGLRGTDFRENPAWEEAVQTVLRAARRAGRPVGMMCVSIEEALQRRAQGFQFLAVASDARYVEQMAQEILRRWRA